ncbi:hypothetical protein AKJ09_07570 [Labilithrix luteola]|uniref:Uncharacterized protein n=1 Tax=Labilithrix luteola TaxID=1391654 RepID=A0A0K1Q5H5_9BACT|nr:hypothetical protein [Labilithrix luteola]AKV00907.1 hypothetical protein AKJ09_07570 [Labilithrix luteola]
MSSSNEPSSRPSRPLPRPSAAASSSTSSAPRPRPADADREALAIVQHVSGRVDVARSLVRIASALLQAQAAAVLRSCAERAMAEIAVREDGVRERLLSVQRFVRAATRAAEDAARQADARKRAEGGRAPASGSVPRT